LRLWLFTDATAWLWFDSPFVQPVPSPTAAVFAAMFPDARNHEHERHPGMHITDTVDYAILLQGELVAIMEEGETVMRAGDITNHAWANRSDSIARIAFILIDSAR